MRGTSFLALLLTALAACASTPEPTVPVGISVTPLDEGRLAGGRAVYAVRAPLEIARAVILDFPAQAEFRPMVLAAELIEAREDGGTVHFRFRGMLGVEPEATCDYVVAEEEDSVVIRYEMTNPSFALQALKGGFRLTPAGDGTQTILEQDFLVSALVMNRQQMLVNLRADAEAMRRRIEEMFSATR